MGKAMIHTEEDDEFARIERENAMKGQPYHFTRRKDEDDDIQEYVRPWKSLTDKEIQKALGVTPDSSNWNMIMVLEWARKIEAAILEKNS
jgi:hypothetical protein